VQIGRQLVGWGQARRLGRRCHRRPDRNRAGRASRSHPWFPDRRLRGRRGEQEVAWVSR